MTKSASIEWMGKPEPHTYAAALLYLSLLYPPRSARAFVAKLRRATASEFKAKDMFRASALLLLGAGNSHVDADRRKISAGKALSPLLLVRDPMHGRVVIADGYHRLCAVYTFDEDAVIPCRIV